MRQFLLVGSALLVAGRAFAGDVEVAEFRREYPDAARRLIQFAETLSGKIVIVETDIVRKTTMRRVGSFQADGGLFRFELERTGPRGERTRSTAGAGPGGMYTLVKDSADSKGGYGVASLGGSQTDLEILNQRFGRYLHASHSMGGTDLAKVSRAPSVRNLTVEPVTVKGRSLRRVKFDVGSEERVNRATVDLDPSASWAVVDWTLEVRHKDDGRFSKMSGSVEYGPPLDGMLVPKVVRVDDVGGKKYVVTFSNLSRPNVSSERFSMKEFGLPELVRLEAPGRSWTSVVALSLGTALLGGTAVVLLARSASRRGRQKGADHENAPAPV